jgi:hypothetical protein
MNTTAAPLGLLEQKPCARSLDFRSMPGCFGRTGSACLTLITLALHQGDSLMKSTRLPRVAIVAVAAVLAGCATPPPPDPAAEVPHCYKTNKGRIIACTSAAAPSLQADADAKRFAPDPTALTVFVVRRNWGDGRNLVKIHADNGPGIETLPNTMVRLKLKPGAHAITFEFEGERQSTTVDGKAGDVRFVRIDGTVWSWKSSYEWASEPEASIRERALKSRLVADVTVR